MPQSRTAYYNQPVLYGGTVFSTYLTDGALILQGGALFSSVVTGAEPSTGRCGVIAVYSATKDYKVLDDSASIVFIGRKKPVAELGRFVFTTGQFSFKVPPPGFKYSCGIETDYTNPALWLNDDATDGVSMGGTSAEANMRQIIAKQHIDSLCCVQDNKGRSYYGLLYNLDVQDLPTGWTQISADFVQVG